MSGRYQFMPPLGDADLDELRNSIRDHGIMVPVLKDPDGQIIDGHHRARIAEELGIDCPVEYVDRPAEQLRDLAFELNLHRRHLTREQKRALVEQSIKADPQLSNREHAKRTGSSHPTAAAVREELEERGEVEELSTRTDSAGHQRPATQPPRLAHTSETPDIEDGSAGTAVPAEPDYSELDRQLDEQFADSDNKFRINFAKAMKNLFVVMAFDRDRIVEVCEHDMLVREFDLFTEWADDLRGRMKPGLRVVGGRHE